MSNTNFSIGDPVIVGTANHRRNPGVVVSVGARCCMVSLNMGRITRTVSVQRGFMKHAAK